MKRFLTTLLISILFLSSYSQDKSTIEVPENIAAWISNEINKSKIKHPINLNSSDFFRKDTARIVGYLKSYPFDATNSTGIIYNHNELTHEDEPSIIYIHPDGRFEADLPLNYPKTRYLTINNRPIISFYAEPGNTLAIVVDWEEGVEHQNNHSVEYIGTLADRNYELNTFSLSTTMYGNFDVKTTPIEEFKRKEQERLEKNLKTIGEESERKALSIEAQEILTHQALLSYGIQLLMFASERDYQATQDTSNQILRIPTPDSYYNFLKEIPLNDKKLFLQDDFNIFINQLEFSTPFHKVWDTVEYKDGIDYYLDVWSRKDSVLRHTYQLESNLTYQATKIRSLKQDLRNMQERNTDINDLNEYVRKTSGMYETPYLQKSGINENYSFEIINSPENLFLQAEAMMLFNREFSENNNTPYQLPIHPGNSILQEIIKHYKNKILFIDFWATWCAPCIVGIESNKKTRNHYKDNNNIVFIFITDETSPLNTYNDIVEKYELANSFRVSEDEFRQLRHLFKFDGIPRYIAIDENGKVLNDRLPTFHISTIQYYMKFWGKEDLLDN